MPKVEMKKVEENTGKKQSACARNTFNLFII
jgi:hypothetical protein